MISAAAQFISSPSGRSLDRIVISGEGIAWLQGIALRAPSSGPPGHSRIRVRDRLLPEGEGKKGAPKQWQ